MPPSVPHRCHRGRQYAARGLGAPGHCRLRPNIALCDQQRAERVPAAHPHVNALRALTLRAWARPHAPRHIHACSRMLKRGVQLAPGVPLVAAHGPAHGLHRSSRAPVELRMQATTSGESAQLQGAILPRRLRRDSATGAPRVRGDAAGCPGRHARRGWFRGRGWASTHPEARARAKICICKKKICRRRDARRPRRLRGQRVVPRRQPRVEENAQRRRGQRVVSAHRQQVGEGCGKRTRQALWRSSFAA